MNNLFDKSGAEFSPDRKYRYALWRIWDETKPLVLFIGLNPSTANETGNDNTITKVCKIAKHNNFGGVYMMNLFPLVSTDPRALIDFYDTPFHDHEEEVNRRCILRISNQVHRIVVAWGSFKEATKQGEGIMRLFYGRDVSCLHINKNGSPKHPLYCKDNTELISYELSKNAQEIPAGGWRSVDIPKEIPPEAFDGPMKTDLIIDETALFGFE